jgi:hypothetical protein
VAEAAELNAWAIALSRLLIVSSTSKVAICPDLTLRRLTVNSLLEWNARVLLILDLPNGRADEKHFRERFAREKKISGLLDLCAHNFPVPEAIAFDNREARAGCDLLTEGITHAIGRFVDEVIGAGHLPLFAIRFETKGEDWRNRPPQTVLNAGYSAIRPEIWRCQTDTVKRVIRETYQERIRPYVEGALPVFENPAEEVRHWVIRMCQQLPPEGEPCAVLIQRMVFGCMDEQSGNGIACNLPGPPDPTRRFQGVFLPCHIGVPTVSGCWGRGQISLTALKALNVRAYNTLREWFDYLESVFGPNRYLEFTIEKERLFLLQHLTRQRDILVD